MHPLVDRLTKQFRLIGHTHPILMALLEVGAAAAPRETDRPERRKIQMRMIRQWEKVEEAFRAFIGAGGTDAELIALAEEGDAEPFYLPNSGWLAPGIDPEYLRGSIAILLQHAANKKLESTPPISYFKHPAQSIMKAPLQLTEQFDTVVTSVESTHTPLDRFLRGSLRTANALAKLLEYANDPEEVMGSPETEAVLEEAKQALLAQGFTY